MKKKWYYLCLLVVFFVAASSSVAGDGVQTRLAALSPPIAEDINPDPDIVEVILNATEYVYDFGTGNQTRVWTYNGITPGPTIIAKLGDTVIIHFYNFLPEGTTIHWHGLELPANMDGSHIAQNPVEPGGYFRYEFKLLRAALFWYHPHIRTNEQVEKGLYGMFLVRDPDQDAELGLPENEHLIVLDDVLLDESGQIMEPFPTDPLENAAVQLNGREGNTFLVNGRTALVDSIQNGVPHRLRVLNASNSRFMRFSIKGHTMWRIGGDGGLLEAPIEVPPIGMVPDPEGGGGMISDPDLSKGILLTPAERADVVFTPLGTDPIELEWHDHARGRHSLSFNSDGTIAIGHQHDDGHLPPLTMATLNLVGDPTQTEYTPPETLRDIVTIDVTGAETIPVIFGHTPPNAAGDVTFFAQMKNGMPLPFQAVTPEDAPMVEVGETRIWQVTNLTGGDHNFHTHGFHFQHIETEFMDMDNQENNFVTPAEFLEDKDTIRLPQRPGAGGGRSRTVTRLAVRFDDTGREGQVLASGKVPSPGVSGGWLFHCHILEHADLGMMSFFQVMQATGIGDHVADIPVEYQLFQNYPNPFNPETEIGFQVPVAGNAKLRVYNVLGQQVRLLADKRVDAGMHRVTWDGKDDSGVAVSSGTYFYHLSSGQFSQVKAMSLVR